MSRVLSVVLIICCWVLGLSSTSAQDQFVRQLSDEEIEQGWIQLFDGSTFFGWKNESDANFRIEDNVIVVDQGTKPGLLRTTSQFDNYRLKVEFRSQADTNSGLFLRTSPVPTDPTLDCFELNIADPGVSPFTTGALVGRAKAEREVASREWQTFEVEMNEGSVSITLDGKPICFVKESLPVGRGYIGLQYNKGRVEFRKVLLQPIIPNDLFNKKDLSGWKSYPKLPGKFEVTSEGELHVTGGPGMLESEKSYGNFVCQVTCRTNAANLNSGFFFRCIPGEQLNGYESQIQNGYLQGNRTEPADWGTGAIFRRVKARLVNADDLKWFTKTIVANDANLSVWVNGLQVTDWTDSRDPDSNPRKGRRLEPGTIMLQAHDETTDVSFKAIRAAELAPRQKRAAKPPVDKK